MAVMLIIDVSLPPSAKRASAIVDASFVWCPNGMVWYPKSIKHVFAVLDLPTTHARIWRGHLLLDGAIPAPVMHPFPPTVLLLLHSVFTANPFDLVCVSGVLGHDVVTNGLARWSGQPVQRG